jgi:hypothetical protein
MSVPDGPAHRQKRFDIPTFSMLKAAIIEQLPKKRSNFNNKGPKEGGSK